MCLALQWRVLDSRVPTRPSLREMQNIPIMQPLEFQVRRGFQHWFRWRLLNRGKLRLLPTRSVKMDVSNPTTVHCVLRQIIVSGHSLRLEQKPKKKNAHIDLRRDIIKDLFRFAYPQKTLRDPAHELLTGLPDPPN